MRKWVQWLPVFVIHIVHAHLILWNCWTRDFFSTSLQRHYEASLYGPKHFRLYKTIYEVHFLARWITTVLVYINLFSVSSNQQVVHVWCFEADSLQFKIISLPDWVQNYALKSGGTNMVTSTLEQKERWLNFITDRQMKECIGLL